MNILFLNAKRKWCGVLTLESKIINYLNQLSFHNYFISRKRSFFSKESLKTSKIFYVKIGMEFNPVLILTTCLLIKKLKIDLIITNMKKEVIIGGIAAKIFRLKNIRIVGNERDFEPKKISHFIYKHFANHFIVPSIHAKNEILKRCNWINEEKISVIYNGQSLYRPTIEIIENQRKEWGLTKNEIILGFTGRLKKNKAVDQLILAFKKICAKYPKLRLVITGNGSEIQNLKDLVKSLEIENKVHFAGFSNTPLLSAASYDIGILTSKYEGFPFVLLEYMATETAIISSDFPSVNEVVSDGKNGLIYHFGNIDDLGLKISFILDNPQKKNQMINNAKSDIVNKFTEEKMLHTFKDIFIMVSKENR